MKLNHLNLTVSNVLEAHRFLEKHFGLKGLGGKPSEAMGFLSDDNGMVLSLFRAKGEVKYPPGFHVGFVQESEAQVDQIHKNQVPQLPSNNGIGSTSATPTVKSQLDSAMSD